MDVNKKVEGGRQSSLKYFHMLRCFKALNNAIKSHNETETKIECFWNGRDSFCVTNFLSFNFSKYFEEMLLAPLSFSVM